jgi:hypothetical protein
VEKLGDCARLWNTGQAIRGTETKKGGKHAAMNTHRTPKWATTIFKIITRNLKVLSDSRSKLEKDKKQEKTHKIHLNASRSPKDDVKNQEKKLR